MNNKESRAGNNDGLPPSVSSFLLSRQLQIQQQRQQQQQQMAQFDLALQLQRAMAPAGTASGTEIGSSNSGSNPLFASSQLHQQTSLLLLLQQQQQQQQRQEQLRLQQQQLQQQQQQQQRLLQNQQTNRLLSLFGRQKAENDPSRSVLPSTETTRDTADMTQALDSAALRAAIAEASASGRLQLPAAESATTSPSAAVLAALTNATAAGASPNGAASLTSPAFLRAAQLPAGPKSQNDTSMTSAALLARALASARLPGTPAFGGVGLSTPTFSAASLPSALASVPGAAVAAAAVSSSSAADEDSDSSSHGTDEADGKVDDNKCKRSSDYDDDDDDENGSEEGQVGSGKGRFGESHTAKWNSKYKQLIDFVKKNGHALVPLEYKENAALAHWVKRQRCQYKVKQQGKHSTLTDDRQALLDAVGFVWDSHRAAWHDRMQELRAFKKKNGHCNVPSKYAENQSLAIWVKCQRRQYKLYQQNKSDSKSGDKSQDAHAAKSKQSCNISADRIRQLNELGFCWEPRKARAAKRLRSSSSPTALSAARRTESPSGTAAAFCANTSSIRLVSLASHDNDPPDALTKSRAPANNDVSGKKKEKITTKVSSSSVAKSKSAKAGKLGKLIKVSRNRKSVMLSRTQDDSGTLESEDVSKAMLQAAPVAAVDDAAKAGSCIESGGRPIGNSTSSLMSVAAAALSQLHQTKPRSVSNGSKSSDASLTTAVTASPSTVTPPLSTEGSIGADELHKR